MVTTVRIVVVTSQKCGGNVIIIVASRDTECGGHVLSRGVT